MSIKLVVYTDLKTFDNYWYGYGSIEDSRFDETIGKYCIKINYQEDEFHARYQQGRFASGLIFAKLEGIVGN